MKKHISTALLVTFPLFTKGTRLKGYSLIAIVCLTGCTATVVRWNSVRMREEIMAYYNDEIMDNLIRMKEGLPFVHVDISSVSAAGLSQVSGTVAGGDTESFTRTSPSLIGALHTISRVVTAPFAYSVTPLHSDTLTMTAVPVIGPLPADSQVAGASSELDTTKVTEVRKPPFKKPGEEGELKEKTTEKTPKSSMTTIYGIYERYRKSIIEDSNVLVCSEVRPSEMAYVPGTLKRHGLKFYYIREDKPLRKNRALYYELCKSLFTQSRGKTSTKAVNAEFQVFKAEAPFVQPAARP
jgi:hypothetical protein